MAEATRPGLNEERAAVEGLVAAPTGTPASRFLLVSRALLVLLGLPKTLVFNLRYFPLRTALRLPVLVSHRVMFANLGGSVVIEGPVRPGTVLLGFGANGAFDFRRARSVWQNAGAVSFRGPARLGHGFKLSLFHTGAVTFGPDFVLSAESQIVSRDRITFGAGCLVSWDVLVLDSDFHEIVHDEDGVITAQRPITIGDRVWLGARSTVLKGARLGDDVIVAAGALVSGEHLDSGVIIGGNPARVVKTGVRWVR